MTRGRFLFVTWDGGGNVPPALELARRLVERGHSVRILAPGTLRERIQATGAAFRAFPRELEWDEALGRALEDQEVFWTGILAGMPLAEAVVEEIENAPTDVFVVDCMLENSLAAAEQSGLPTAALVHVLYQPWAAMEEPKQWWEDEFNLMNETRATLGLALIPRKRFMKEVWARPDRALVLVPREFDRPGDEPSPNVRYVGPVLDERDSYDWDLPWAPDDPDPLIVISLGMAYQHQEDAVQRILDAVASVPARRLLTLGGAVDGRKLRVPEDVVVRDWIPHGAILPYVSGVVTHGGLGTVSASLAEGVPLVCIPIGREQPLNAGQVEACGAGRTLPEEAGPEEIREAIVDVLASGRFREGARRMAEVIDGYRHGERAIEEVVGLLDEGRART